MSTTFSRPPGAQRRTTSVVISCMLAAGIAVGGAAPALAAAPDYPIEAIGPERDAAKADIVVIDAGGTLTSRARDRISYQHYSGSVDGGVTTILEDMYPELAQVANLEVVTAGGLGGSSRVTDDQLYNVSQTIDAQLAREDVDGVVVTAGTNVLEEDAYFFDLTVQSDKPVVVTGSMHQYGTFTYDAYTNLFSSIRLAASGKTTCYGTVVLLNDQFFAARDVTKTDGYRMDTFEAGAYGALGVVNEDVIRPLRAPSRVMECGTDAWSTPFDLAAISADDLAAVDIAYGYVEASAGTIEGPVASGADGIVVAGHGPGGGSYLQSPAQQAAIDAGVVFVSATRTGGEGTYDSGSGSVIGAGDLLPQKARILLQMALTYSDDLDQVRSWFTSIGNAQFDMSGRNAVEPEPEPEPEPTTEPEPEPSEEPETNPAETAPPIDPAAGGADGPAGGDGASTASSDRGGSLPFTGANTSFLAAAAALLLAGGTWATLRARRSRATTD